MISFHQVTVELPQVRRPIPRCPQRLGVKQSILDKFDRVRYQHRPIQKVLSHSDQQLSSYQDSCSTNPSI